MKISIIGLGWFGSALAKDLARNYEIKGTTRSPDKHPGAEVLLVPGIPSDELMNADVIVLNIPPFANQLEWFKSWNWNQSTHIIFISSTSVFGEMSGEVDENTLPVPESENAKELVACETWFKSFPSSTIIRFGGLIGPDRHPGRSLSGRKNIKGGNQPVNLIHLDDCIGFTKLVIEKHLTHETYNLVHPAHPTRREYYQNWCRDHELPLPEFVDSDTPGKIISHLKVSSLYKFSENSAT